MISYLKEIRDIFFPTNETQVIIIIMVVAWIAISIVCREQFGGFLSALKEVGLGIIILGIFDWIHPGLFILTIAIAILQGINVIPKSWSNWLSTLVAFGAIVGFLFKVNIL